MSLNYAESLSHYENKGKLGLPEIFDRKEVIDIKCKKLAQFIKSSKHTVVHTGAGISTAAGIPDFRGPNGVWTLEKEGKKPSINLSWNEARPTSTHMALVSLHDAGYISCVVTQNIDGLHLRSGLPRSSLAEMHGNFFVNRCLKCKREFVRESASKTVGQKTTGEGCLYRGINNRPCRGKLFDTILDWEHDLPELDLELASLHSCAADLSLCLGTTLQIIPSGNLPVCTKKRGGNLVICNLQPTKQDRFADLIIHGYVDDVMERVLKILNIPLRLYDSNKDPVVCAKNSSIIEWTIKSEWLKHPSLVERSKRKILKAKNKKKLKVEFKNDVIKEHDKFLRAFENKQKVLQGDQKLDAAPELDNEMLKVNLENCNVKVKDIQQNRDQTLKTDENDPLLKTESETKLKTDENDPLLKTESDTKLKTDENDPLLKTESETKLKTDENGPLLKTESEIKLKTDENDPLLKTESDTKLKTDENDPLLKTESETKLKTVENDSLLETESDTKLKTDENDPLLKTESETKLKTDLENDPLPTGN